MADDLFRRLSFGACFTPKALRVERKRTGSASQETRTRGAPLPRSGAAAEEDATLPDELDFFSAPSKALGKRGKAAAADEGPCNKGALEAADCPPPLERPVFSSSDSVNAFRKKKLIRVYGPNVPAPVKRFANLTRSPHGLAPALVERVAAAGISKITPVQMQGTTVMAAGRDALVVAPTGSGKTLVFVLGILGAILSRRPAAGDQAPPRKTVEAVVISPTRELATQIRDEFRRFTPAVARASGKGGRERLAVRSVLLNKALLHSWASARPASYPDVLITTPARLVMAVAQGLVDLSMVRQLVLDEGDKLMELGFIGQVDDILAACTSAGGAAPMQKCLFSATIPSGVEDLARSFMSDDAVRVVVGTPNASIASIKQELVYVGQEEGKIMAIRQMLNRGIKPPVIVFADTIERADALFVELVKHNVNADTIHSSRPQAERERIIEGFRRGSIWFLITTELLARGLDFPDVTTVINYDFPPSTASYIHRIGRTGRAGRRGRAITFFGKADAPSLRIVTNVMRSSGVDVPKWMHDVSSVGVEAARLRRIKPKGSSRSA